MTKRHTLAVRSPHSALPLTLLLTLHPDRIIWVVVGDRSVIEAPLRGAGFGEIRVIDPDGELIPSATAPE